jgi:hypothetical protein
VIVTLRGKNEIEDDERDRLQLPKMDHGGGIEASTESKPRKEEERIRSDDENQRN